MVSLSLSFLSPVTLAGLTPKPNSAKLPRLRCPPEGNFRTLRDGLQGRSPRRWTGVAWLLPSPLVSRLLILARFIGDSCGNSIGGTKGFRCDSCSCAGDALGSSKEAQLRDVLLTFGPLDVEGFVLVALAGTQDDSEDGIEKVNGGEDDNGLLGLSRFGTYLCDPGPEMGMAITPGNAAEFLLEFGFVEACEVAREADQGVSWGDCSVAGDALGVLELTPERSPLLLLEFRSAV